MNVFTRYYIDWLNQCLACIDFYIMYSTIALFLIGMCLYIMQMVDDLRLTLNELSDDVGAIRGIMTEIRFHREILE